MCTVLIKREKIDSTLTDVIKVMILKRVPIHSMKFVPFIVSHTLVQKQRNCH